MPFSTNSLPPQPAAHMQALGRRGRTAGCSTHFAGHMAGCAAAAAAAEQMPFASLSRYLWLQVSRTDVGMLNKQCSQMDYADLLKADHLLKDLHEVPILLSYLLHQGKLSTSAMKTCSSSRIHVSIPVAAVHFSSHHDPGNFCCCIVCLTSEASLSPRHLHIAFSCAILCWQNLKPRLRLRRSCASMLQPRRRTSMRKCTLCRAKDFLDPALPPLFHTLRLLLGQATVCRQRQPPGWPMAHPHLHLW